ncbi:MAG: zinc transporter ZupT [Proteobacteria bacterium]|nr:zinc transporter ZupT [Pseudomonadota bacterium]
MDGNLFVAFGLTLFAGLSTGLGSLVLLLSKKPSLRVLSVGLGFSCGVMVFISLYELLPISVEELKEGWSEEWGAWVAMGAFFAGIITSALIDSLVPKPQNPHEVVPVSEITAARKESEMGSQESRELGRVGVISALAIALHNLPEGMATFVAAMADPVMGLSIAIAVAIHNIPEGIAVAVPIYFATKSKSKAALHSFLSGLAEPLGGLIVFLFLWSYIDQALVGGMLAFVGGIMVFISFDELLPTAREYGKGHDAIGGLIVGMAVMAFSLLLLE